MSDKREDYISWDEYFMGVAMLSGFGSLLCFCETQILSFIANPGTAMRRKIPYVKLVNHRIGDFIPGVGISVDFPTGRIGGIQIQDHTSFTVDSSGSGIGVTGFADMSINHNAVSIVNTVQIAHSLRNPGSLYIGMHPLLPNQIISAGCAAAVKIDGDLLSGWCPKPEKCSVGIPVCSKVTAGVSVLVFKCLGRIEIVHSDVTPVHLV